jgi:capsular exopolysaccharide synthesis family protein
MNYLPDRQSQANRNAMDLYAPASRFDSASRLHGRMHRWWLLLGRFWPLSTLIFLMVLGPAIWLAILSRPTYESRARMWVTGKINVGESWSYTEELVNFLGTQAALLESPAIQGRAMARLRAESASDARLAEAANSNHLNSMGGARAFWRKLAGTPEVQGSNAPPPIPFQVKVLEGAKSSTLELRGTGSEPLSTRHFVNCLMKEYLEFKRESRDQASGQATASLSAEAARLKSELDAAREKLQTFQATNNVVMLQQQGSGAENYLASLNRQLAVLRTEQKLLEGLQPDQWAQAAIAQSGGSQASGDEAMARQLAANLAQSQTALFQADQQMHLLVAQRDELARFLQPAHPKIVKLNQDIATQQQIVQVARNEASRQLGLRRSALQAQIQNLENASEDWNTKAIEAGRRVAEYTQLQQNTQRLQAAWDKTLGLVQNLDDANHVEQENVGILDPASLARATHRRFKVLAVAVVLAFGLSFGVLFGIGIFQDGFASNTELAGQFVEPVVGQIPRVSFRTSNGQLGIDGAEKQQFEFLEAFRSIRATLPFLNNGGGTPQTLVITSSVPEEGKSTVALYLAATMARTGSRVLLVDGDLRRPGLHKFFGLPNGPGLAALLEQPRPAEAPTLQTGTENLWLLPAGRASHDPGDLVTSPRWPEVLGSLKSQFDCIVVDAPPVAATDDAATMGAKVDGVLFIVRAFSTSARVARGVLAVLRRRQVPVLGLIYNQAISSPCERQYYQPYADMYYWEATRSENDRHSRIAAKAHLS